ncbi:hypothetical protein [Arthrobacter sp. R4-81]
MATYSITTTREATEAEKIRTEQRDSIEAIRANRNLSPEGKKAQIARVHLQAKNEITKLERQEAGNRKARINDIRKQVFGLTGYQSAQDVISYRDAQDRVAGLGTQDEQKAMALYDRAELSGDSILAAALVNRALEAGWLNLANTYIEANPYKGAMVEELWHLQQAEPGANGSVQEEIVNSLAFHIQKPTELSNTHMDSQIEAIANSAD